MFNYVNPPLSVVLSEGTLIFNLSREMRPKMEKNNVCTVSVRLEYKT